jgi:4-hydroxybenzoate polyprenyltransferase
MVVLVVALLAGAPGTTALVLGLSMTLLQFAIGTLNDIVDARSDAGLKPGKPIPAGLVRPWQAWLIGAGCAALGVGIAALYSPWLAGLALLGLAIGAWYDLGAKGTALSWLPFAVGIPLLPVYGWFGATGTLPAMFLVVIPAAASAGTAIAISNALVDLERDEAAGDSSIAVALGARRAGRLVIGLHLVVAALVVATAAVLGAPSGWILAVVLACLIPTGGAVLGAAAATRPGTSWREAAFEIQAVGTGLLAVAWLGAISAASTSTIGA